jgi:HAMP domain-containing protein
VAQVSGVQWLVCMTVSSDELAQRAAGQRNVLIAIGAAALVLVAALIIIFNRVVVLKPLAAIAAFAATVADGDLKATLTGRFRFELADLARNLERMVAELKHKLGFAQGVMEGISAPCGIVGPDNNITWANQQICDLLEKPDTPGSYVGQKSGLAARSTSTSLPRRFTTWTVRCWARCLSGPTRPNSTTSKNASLPRTCSWPTRPTPLPTPPTAWPRPPSSSRPRSNRPTTAPRSRTTVFRKPSPPWSR